MVKEKATKEEKTTTGLKKQLLKKLNEMAEKNKTLLDLQGKVNKGEEKLLELQREVSRIPDLETKIKELEGTVTSRDEMLAARDMALLTYQRDLEHWKTTIGHAMEENKSSKDFAEEVIEATGEAFKSGFNSYKDLVRKYFSNLDLSGIVMEALLALTVGMEA
ncbi:hypothetical protein COCNU_08G000500 [Cocos nucifera]|uniref:Uncharacterized protein n=1 Tax=Cocos nucifera TaxID=13894 RepID=A0A8K0N5T6_COCNU|nr:hypothetical protein COCNU_08G000500 [Cocos nucifera]